MVSMLVFEVLWAQGHQVFYHLTESHCRIGRRTQPLTFSLKNCLCKIVGTYLNVALNAMFYFPQAWYEQQRITQALQKDKIEASVGIAQIAGAAPLYL